MAGTRVLESESGAMGEGNEEEQNKGRKKEREATDGGSRLDAKGNYFAWFFSTREDAR